MQDLNKKIKTFINEYIKKSDKKYYSAFENDLIISKNNNDICGCIIPLLENINDLSCCYLSGSPKYKFCYELALEIYKYLDVKMEV